MVSPAKVGQLRKPTHFDDVTTLAGEMYRSIHSTKKIQAVGFSEEDKARSPAIRLADMTHQSWKSLSLTHWQRDLGSRAATFINAINYLQQYQSTVYSFESIRRLRKELTLVFQDLSGVDSNYEFQWWDQPMFDGSEASGEGEDDHADVLERTLKFHERSKVFQKKLQGLIDEITTHELSNTNGSLSAPVREGLLLMTEVCNISHFKKATLISFHRPGPLMLLGRHLLWIPNCN
jgi:hypothetical protein